MANLISYPEPWQTIVKRMGGVQATADYFCVSRVTLWRWAHGKHAIPGPAINSYENLIKLFHVEQFGKRRRNG